MLKSLIYRIQNTITPRPNKSLTSDLAIPGSAATYGSLLKDWNVREEGDNQSLIFKEFDSKCQGDVLVALTPGKAVVFKDTKGNFLNADVLAEYIIRDKKPEVEPIVTYISDYNCFAWHDDYNYSVFDPDNLSRITDAIQTIVNVAQDPKQERGLLSGIRRN